jgi:hypothetical protein
MTIPALSVHSLGPTPVRPTVPPHFPFSSNEYGANAEGADTRDCSARETISAFVPSFGFPKEVTSRRFLGNGATPAALLSVIHSQRPDSWLLGRHVQHLPSMGLFRAAALDVLLVNGRISAAVLLNQVDSL